MQGNDRSFTADEITTAQMWCHMATRTPLHPRRLASSLHIAYPDHEQHANLRWACAHCPPCEHEYERDWLDSDIEHASCTRCNKPMFRYLLDVNMQEQPNPEWSEHFDAE